MKYLLLLVSIAGTGFFSKAQNLYRVSSDGPNEMLVGQISRDRLENDTAFRWFHDNLTGYMPDAETVNVLKAKGPEIRFVVFGGTWCEDTQHLLPKFYALMDAAGIGDNQILLIAVDRQKKSLDHLPETLHLVSTPTFIVLKGDEQMGRVIEYGKNGHWEQELREIVAAKF